MFFNRQLNDKLPTVNKRNEIDEKIRKRQRDQFDKAKQTHDEKTKARESHIKVGDYVIVRITDKPNKMASSYSKTIYKVIERKQSLVRISDELGNSLTRNVTWVKKVTLPEKETEIKVDEPKNKQYPKRNRKPVQRYGH